MIIKAIIFDFDGTLADTLPLCFHAFQQVFKDYDDKDLTDEEIKGMFGPPETEIIKENLTNERLEEAIELYYQQYIEKHKEMVKADKGMLDLLAFLKKEDLKLGIVTGKSRRSLDISMDELEMAGYFDVIITGDDVEESKPSPEGVLKALKELDVPCEDAAFLGDSDADIAAGKQAGVYTVGVQWLPTVQSSTFSEEPNDIIYEINHFKDRSFNRSEK